MLHCSLSLYNKAQYSTTQHNATAWEVWEDFHTTEIVCESYSKIIHVRTTVSLLGLCWFILFHVINEDKTSESKVLTSSLLQKHNNLMCKLYFSPYKDCFNLPEEHRVNPVKENLLSMCTWSISVSFPLVNRTKLMNNPLRHTLSWHEAHAYIYLYIVVSISIILTYIGVGAYVLCANTDFADSDTALHVKNTPGHSITPASPQSLRHHSKILHCITSP